ncbi:MAG TPA: hypothetical protein VE545_09500, partial [Candidatus Dormibacteraeota bacterium]|nr:hypothetical protein [Candidatus Dormibacteraeota bacterium]
ANIHYGVTMARRAWLTSKDVINTLPVEQFLAALRPKPGSANEGKSAVATAVPKRPLEVAKKSRKPLPQGLKPIGSQALKVGAKAPTPGGEKVSGASKKPKAKKASR